jgi:hypothetical protein
MKPKLSKDQIEAILCAEKYRSREEAIAACQAVSEPGDEIHIHDPDCEVDDNDEGCTCEPIIVVHRADLATA